jgi:hypothetical protein
VAWSVKQSCGNTSGGGTTLAATFGIALTAGSKLIAYVSQDGNGTSGVVSSVKDGAGNSFNLMVDISGSADSFLEDVSVWELDTPAGDAGTTPTITVTVSVSAEITMIVEEVTGLQPGTTPAVVLDLATTAAGTVNESNGAPSTLPQPAYSSTVSSEFLVTVYGDNGNGNDITVPSGYTADTNNNGTGSNTNLCVGYKNSTGGAESGSWTITAGSGATGCCMVVVAFQLAGSGTAAQGSPATGAGRQFRRPYRYRYWRRYPAYQSAASLTQQTPFYPLNRPVAARGAVLPSRGQIASRNSGAAQGTGTAFYPIRRPAAAVARPLPARGQARSGAGAAQGTGSPFRSLTHPVQARAIFPVRGRNYGNKGIAQSTGAPFYAYRHPADAVVRPLPSRGSAQSRSGQFQGTGSPFYPLRHPAGVIRQTLPARGTAQGHAGVRGQLGPPVTPLQRPVQARYQTLPARGRTQGRAGTFTSVTRAVFYPLSHPAGAVIRPLPARGYMQSRTGILAGTGAPFYPLRQPADTHVRVLPPRGYSASRPGVSQGTGTAFYPLRHPVSAQRAALPPRGRTASLPGQIQGTGASLTQLRRPVQARLPLPRRGVTQWRTGAPVISVVQAVFYPLSRPAGAVTRPLPVRGRTAGSRGIAQGTGPAAYPLQRALQARPRLPLRGVAQGRAGVSGTVLPPAVAYPLRRPVAAAVRPLPPRGVTRSSAGVAQGTGAPLTQLRRPSGAVTRPLPARGRTQWRSGTAQLTGPAVTPLQRAVRARLPLQPPPRGYARGSAGVSQHTGGTPKPLPGPVRAAWRYLPPRGRAGGSPGAPVTQTVPFKSLARPVMSVRQDTRRGRITITPAYVPPVVPPANRTTAPVWHSPVRARIPLPVRGGLAHGSPGGPVLAVLYDVQFCVCPPAAAWRVGRPFPGWQVSSPAAGWQLSQPDGAWVTEGVSGSWQPDPPSSCAC